MVVVANTKSVMGNGKTMKSIIFTSDNPGKVRDGSKTQTRRVVKQSLPTETTGVFWDIFAEYWVATDGVDRLLEPIKSRYGVGDVLYVKEAWCELVKEHRPPQFAYKADMSIDGEEFRQEYIKAGYPYKWRSPLFMPQSVARTFIEITGVRCERVQDISEDDAKAEGVDDVQLLLSDGLYEQSVSAVEHFGRKYVFGLRWNEIHHKTKQHTWSANPWVFVYEFKRVEK